jgi:hypothetical protein
LWRPECRDKAAAAANSVAKPVFQATANFSAGFTENIVGVEAGTPPINRNSRLYAAGQSFSNMISGLGPEMNRAEAGPTARVDRTGKMHGELPNHIPKDWTRETIEEFGDDLRGSIRTRRNEQLRLGEDGPHRERLRQEERLLRQVERRLSGS